MSVVLKTTQVSALKVITDTLKDLIQDVTWEFVKNGEPTSGCTLLALDNSKSALLYMFLDPQEINKSGSYKCDISASVGINLITLHKILKTIKDNDTISINLIPGKQTEDCLFIDSANLEKKKYGHFAIPLLDMDTGKLFSVLTFVEKYDICEQDFDSTIIIKADEFQQILKDLSCVCGEKVWIAVTKDGFRLASGGEEGNASFTLGKKSITDSEDSGVLIDSRENAQTIMENVYSLKFLQVFAKATKLSYDLKIQMKQDKPITLSYHIPNLGLLRFSLAPQPKDENIPVPKPTKKLKNLEERQNQYLSQMTLQPGHLYIHETEDFSMEMEDKEKIIKKVKQMEKQLLKKKKKEKLLNPEPINEEPPKKKSKIAITTEIDDSFEL
jgi:proliferating cell nuclear antigen